MNIFMAKRRSFDGELLIHTRVWKKRMIQDCGIPPTLPDIGEYGKAVGCILHTCSGSGSRQRRSVLPMPEVGILRLCGAFVFPIESVV